MKLVLYGVFCFGFLTELISACSDCVFEPVEYPKFSNDDPNERPRCGNNCGTTCSTYQNPDIISSCSKFIYDFNVGFVLNEETGLCVRPEECPIPSCNGDPNAVRGCGVNCGRTCTTYQNADEVSCILSCDENGCDCKYGFVQDETTGLCICPEDCPIPSCNGDPNAVRGCGVNCGRTCTTYQNADEVSCILPCDENGCDCKDGFVLDETTGLCICPEDCPIPSCNGDPNAVRGCGVNCGRTCTTYQNADEVSCILPCDENGCDCKDGFVLDETTGLCVCPEDCRKCSNGDPNGSPGCGVNCGRTCRTYKNPEHAICPKICNVNGCDCNIGFVLDETTGWCIRPEECPPPCPEGEVYSTCPSSDYCLLKDPNRYPIFTPAVCKNPGCVCGFNQRRSIESNKCIAASSCPPFPCAENEVYDSCPPICPGEKCSDYIDNSTCPRFGRIGIVVPCKPQCRCVDGHYRDGSNNCVPAAQCQAEPTCPPGEVWEPCPEPCPPQICSTIWSRRRDCVEANSNYTCKGQCRCKDGYRNYKGECISTENCLKCRGPNEYFSCGGACDNVCFDLEVQNQTSCNIINIVCNEMCYCKDGYARDPDGICVKYEDCPPKCTGKNEVYSTCATSCEPTCDSIGAPEDDMCVGAAVCSIACVCIDGYYRNIEGECVAKSECTTCGGDPNAIPGCGVNCNRHCSDVGSTTRHPCPFICKANSCDCKPGFYLNDNTKKCVNECDCT